MRYKITLFLTFLLFGIGLIVYQRHGHTVEANYNFNGVVEEIVFNEKGSPSITVSGQSFFVTFPDRHFIRQISCGDSLEKKQGSWIYRLVKKNSEEIIYSK